MLFRLNTLWAVVVDIPMCARDGNEISNMKISKLIGELTFKHLKNFGKRIFYNYYLRDMSLASAGVVMLAALPVILGLQFILAFIGYDIASVPKKPLHPMKKWQR